MRKTLVTFTIAISLGFSGTIANAQEAAPAGPTAQVADSMVVAETEAAPAPADAATTNNTEATTEATTAAESDVAEPANAEADQPEITQTADTANQSQKASSNPTLRTVGIVVSLLGLIGGGIFWAIQQNLINIPGLPGLPNLNPAPAPAPQGKYYPNCKAVWDELGRPIQNGEPGYDRNLDHDGDGVGCEQRPR